MSAFLKRRWLIALSVVALGLALGVSSWLILSAPSKSLSLKALSSQTFVSGEISGISASLSDSAKSATSTLTLTLTATTALPQWGGKINIQFNGPSGNSSTTNYFDFNNATINSSSTSGLAVYNRNWNGITLYASSEIPASSAITLVIDNVKNPDRGGKYFAHVWTSNYYQDLDGSGNWAGDYNSTAVTVGTNTNVVGTITDDLGAPVPFSYVNIYNPNWSSYYYTYTDSAGAYGFADVPEGTYTVDLSYYAGNNTGKVYFPPDRSTITVASSGVTTKNVSFLSTPKTLSVKVRKDSADGAGTSNANVYLYKVGGSGWASKAVDSSGNVSFTLPGGNWSVGVNPSTWPADWAYSYSYETVNFANDATTESKEKVFVVDSTTATVSGKMVYPDGSSFNNQWLAWMSFSNTKNQYFSAQFDSYGNFSTKLTAGTYTVQCGVSDQQYSCPKIANFSVGKDETKDLGTLTLAEKKNAISGKITAGGEAVAGAYVSLWTDWASSEGNYEWGYTTTAADGTYRIPVVGEGKTYSISAYPQWKEGGSDYVYSGQAETVKVNTGTVEKNFVFKKATNTLNITITDPAGTVLTDFYAWVSAGDGSQSWGNIGTSVKGVGSLKVPSGTWDVQSYIYFNDYSSPDAQKVTFSGDNETKSITFQAVKNSATLEGTVKDESGNAITGTWISVYATRGKNGSWYNSTFDQGTGKYSMKVAPGTLRLGYWVDQNLGYSSQNQDVEVSLGENETKTHDITLKKADSEVRVEAVKPDGSAMKWAWVTADTRDPKEKRASTYYYSNGSSTDINGNATIKLPAGTYFVNGNMWAGSGYINPKTEKVTISKDSPASVKLVFRSADATIRGKVTRDGAGANAFVTAWSEDSGYSEITANNDGDYSIATSKGTKWHLRAILEVDNAVYKSKEQIVDLTGTDSTTQNIELIKQNYVLPESQTVTFDPNYQQAVILTDGTTITIPAKAMGSSGKVTLTVEPTATLAEEVDAKPISYGYKLRAFSDTGEEIKKFTSNVTIESKYVDGWLTDSKVLSAAELSLGYYDESAGTWIELPQCTVDEAQHVVTCQTDHFTTFALTASTDSIAPNPPSKISATSGDTKAVLRWTAPTETDFAGVNIYRSTKSGYLGDEIRVKQTGSSYDDTGLTNGVEYFYVVRSVDNSGNESTNSTQVSATPAAATVPPVSDQIAYLGDKLLPDDLANLPPTRRLPVEAVALIVLLVIFELALKARGMWIAARKNQQSWFIAILIFNTIGLLPILYIWVFNVPERRETIRRFFARIFARVPWLVRAYWVVERALVRAWGNVSYCLRRCFGPIVRFLEREIDTTPIVKLLMTRITLRRRRF